MNSSSCFIIRIFLHLC